MRRPRLPLLAGVWGLGVGVAAFAGVPWPLVGVLHGLGGGLAWGLYRHALPTERLVARRSALIALCFPGVGALAAWLTLPRDLAVRGTLLDQYRDFTAYEAPSVAPLPVRDVDEALRSELSVRPLSEELALGDLAAKQAAATSLATLEGPRGIAELREALNASHDETRLFASLALLKREETLTAELVAARARSEAAPDDVAALLEVARVARRYVETGLPDGSSAPGYWQEVEQLAERALTLPHPIEQATQAQLLRVAAMRSLGRPREALAAAETACELAPHDPEARLALGETLYALGELDRLAAWARAMARDAVPGSRSIELAAYWSARDGR